MGKKLKAPPGLDYQPVTGDVEHVSFGVAQAGGDAGLTVEQFIGKRAFPVMRPKDLTLPWPKTTCYKLDVQLPRGASDELWDPQRLAQAYDRQCFSAIRDLVVIVTLRFPEVDEGHMRLHEAWRLGWGFADKLVKDHGVAVVAAMHVPARAAKLGLPHVHLMIPARQLLPSGFGKFARPLATDDGRALVEKAWAAWREATDVTK
ncbi:hypothetical protein HJG53_06290 [Sphingomonas sp. ID1715]|uniref:hypothetical protein n=1 Tax=Sphingomonas sp. ID1715 TaxID=1656898 RepID=UPI001489B10D|nr:hypothetical protein [Sphingomonas sp. ID1715]NNM76511.1 hypothetical protein [Sphingomonas sp. ID1715]